jgi:hypothetical protein
MAEILQLQLECSHHMAVADNDNSLVLALSGQMGQDVCFQAQAKQGNGFPSAGRIRQERVQVILALFELEQAVLLVFRAVVHQRFVALAQLEFDSPVRARQCQVDRCLFGADIVRNIEPVQRHRHVIAQPPSGRVGLLYAFVRQAEVPAVLFSEFGREECVISPAARLASDIAFGFPVSHKNEVYRKQLMSSVKVQLIRLYPSVSINQILKSELRVEREDPWRTFLDADSDISGLSREERHQMLLELETRADVLLETEMASQEEAWDMYFGLLHECDESRFLQDRARILAKIDTQRYNPFKSKNPEIVMLARLRASGMGLTSQN